MRHSKLIFATGLLALSTGCGSHPDSSGSHAPAPTVLASPEGAIGGVPAPVNPSACGRISRSAGMRFLGAPPPSPNIDLRGGSLLCEFKRGSKWLIVDYATADSLKEFGIPIDRAFSTLRALEGDTSETTLGRISFSDRTATLVGSRWACHVRVSGARLGRDEMRYTIEAVVKSLVGG